MVFHLHGLRGDSAHTLGNSLTFRAADLWHACLHGHVYCHVPVRQCTQDFCDAVEPLRSLEKKNAFANAAFEKWLEFSDHYCNTDGLPDDDPFPAQCPQHVVRYQFPHYHIEQVVAAAEIDEHIEDLPPKVVQALRTGSPADWLDGTSNQEPQCESVTRELVWDMLP